MLDKNPIEARVLSQIESAEGDVIEYIIEQFPAELRDRLYLEVEHMEDAEAVTHLSTRLINRRFSLSVNVEKMLSSEGVEVVHGYPRAILQHIENSYASKEEIRLGSGNNGEVIASINQPGTCYKLLYLKRAQEMAATAAREALLQYQAYEALRNKVDVAKVPAVI